MALCCVCSLVISSTLSVSEVSLFNTSFSLSIYPLNPECLLQLCVVDKEVHVDAADAERRLVAVVIEEMLVQLEPCEHDGEDDGMALPKEPDSTEVSTRTDLSRAGDTE